MIRLLRRKPQGCVGCLLLAVWLTACAPLAPSDIITPMPSVTPSSTASVTAAPSVTPNSASSVTAPRSVTADSTPVPVTVILQAAPLGDTPAQPVYTIVTDPKEWDSLSGQIPEAALQAGREASAPVIVAFAGVKGSSGYLVNVRDAVLQADRLIVTVEVTAPGAADIVEPATTLPFVVAALPSDVLATARSYIIVDHSSLEVSRGELTAP